MLLTLLVSPVTLSSELTTRTKWLRHLFRFPISTLSLPTLLRSWRYCRTLPNRPSSEFRTIPNSLTAPSPISPPSLAMFRTLSIRWTTSVSARSPSFFSGSPDGVPVRTLRPNLSHRRCRFARARPRTWPFHHRPPCCRPLLFRYRL
jgi:hypothetical protein